MQNEFAAVNTREKILPDKRYQRKREHAEEEKTDDEKLAVANCRFQQAMVTIPEMLEANLESCLHAHQRISRTFCSFPALLLGLLDQQVPGHRGDQRAGEQ